MQIKSIYDNTTFCKRKIFNCTVKRAKTQERQNAALYLYNKSNPMDMREIADSNLPFVFKENFLNLNSSPYSKFYVLKTEDTDEFISSAQVGRHFNLDSDKYLGSNTVIEELESNPEFVNPQLPLLSEIASDAYNDEDEYIFTSFGADEKPEMKKFSFSQTKFNNWIIPQRRYVNLIDKAEKQNQIEYLC